MLLVSDDVIEKLCYGSYGNSRGGEGGEGRLPPPPAPHLSSGPGRETGSPTRILRRGRVAEVCKRDFLVVLFLY